MSEEKTDVEILALLTAELPPEPRQEWHRNDNRQRWLLWRDDVNRLLVAGPGISGWYFGWEDGIRGTGADIPAAVADFRRQVLADVVAVGAVPKAAPASGYNEVEAAIFGAAIVEQVAEARLLGRWPGNTAALMLRFIEEAEGIVEVYRAAIK